MARSSGAGDSQGRCGGGNPGGPYVGDVAGELVTQSGFWGRLRLRGIDFHGLSYREAITLAIVFYEQSFPDELARNRKWMNMAEKMGIEVITDEILEKQRKDRALAVAQAEFLGD